MKRKKASPKARKPLPVKPLGELGAAVLKNLPAPTVGGTFGWWDDEGNYAPGKPGQPRKEVADVPLPSDLELAVRYYARQEFWSLENDLTRPPWTYLPDGEDSEANYPGWKEADIPPNGWHQIRRVLEDCVRKGFYLALLRYADDLKKSAEAAPLIDGWRQAARKGAAARRAQAEPNHKAIRKRFRELRKTVPKKTARYVRVAGEFGKSDRQIARIVDGID